MAKLKSVRLWGGLPPGATVVVDTAPFIYILENHAQFAPLFIGLFEAAAALDLHIALSTVTLAEVLTGPYKSGHTALAKRYEQALSAYTLVSVSPAIATLAAQLRAQYRLRLPDAIQLATAVDVGAAAFVTHDRDFSQVIGLSVLTGDSTVTG
jgi:predicted nucleic acid-binding protein